MRETEPLQGFEPVNAVMFIAKDGSMILVEWLDFSKDWIVNELTRLYCSDFKRGRE